MTEGEKGNEQNDSHSLLRTIAPKMFISSCEEEISKLEARNPKQ